jgi:glyoxylate reductase
MAEIAVTSVLPGGVVEPARARHRVRVSGIGPLAGGALVRFVGEADALVCNVGDRVDGAVLDACPGLAVVANVGVGVDNIDLAAARRRGLWVTNTPDVLTEATADLTWALLLAVTRRVADGDRLIRSRAAWQWRPDFFLGAGLQGKSLGIVGMGRIGRAVARRAQAFGLTVRCNDRARIGDADALGTTYVADLDELLAVSDIVSLHCPLTAETRHLLDERRLRLLPRGAFVVNTSRGPVVDEDALVRVLESGHLGGAGLDVFEREPVVHPGLLDRDDVVLLPHLGSATLETRAAMGRLALENALAVLDGRRPATPVVEGHPARPK